MGHQVNTLFCLIAAKRNKGRPKQEEIEQERERGRIMPEKESEKERERERDDRLWESRGYKPLYQI